MKIHEIIKLVLEKKEFYINNLSSQEKDYKNRYRQRLQIAKPDYETDSNEEKKNMLHLLQ